MLKKIKKHLKENSELYGMAAFAAVTWVGLASVKKAERYPFGSDSTPESRKEAQQDA